MASRNAKDIKGLSERMGKFDAQLAEVKQHSPAPAPAPAPAGTTLLWLLSIVNLLGLVVVVMSGRSHFKTIEKRGAYDAATHRPSKNSNREMQRLRADIRADVNIRMDQDFRTIRKELNAILKRLNERLSNRLGSRPETDKDTEVSAGKPKELSVGRSKNPAEQTGSTQRDGSPKNYRKDDLVNEVKVVPVIGNPAEDGGTTTRPEETTNPSSKPAPASGNEMLVGRHSPSQDRDLNHATILAYAQQNNTSASIKEIKQKIADLLHSSESVLVVKNLQPIERKEKQFHTSNTMGLPGEGVIVHFSTGTKAYFLPTRVLNEMAHLIEGCQPGDEPDKSLTMLPELEKKGDVYELVKPGLRR